MSAAAWFLTPFRCPLPSIIPLLCFLYLLHSSSRIAGSGRIYQATGIDEAKICSEQLFPLLLACDNVTRRISSLSLSASLFFSLFCLVHMDLLHTGPHQRVYSLLCAHTSYSIPILSFSPPLISLLPDLPARPPALQKFCRMAGDASRTTSVLRLQFSWGRALPTLPRLSRSYGGRRH